MQFFTAECIDKTTGRSFDLRLWGEDAEEARSVPAAWGFITGSPTAMKTPWFFAERTPNKVRDANPTDDLDLKLSLRHDPCHAMDRHFLLQSMAEDAYKLRDNRADALKWCEWACWQWLIESPILIEGFKSQGPRFGFPRMNVPKRLVILLEKSGEKARAYDVARTCQSLDLKIEDIAYLSDKEYKLAKFAEG